MDRAGQADPDRFRQRRRPSRSISVIRRAPATGVHRCAGQTPQVHSRLSNGALRTTSDAVRIVDWCVYEPVAPDPDAGRRENQDPIRPGSEGPDRRHQMAITGSQIAQPSDECDANGMIGVPRR